MSRPTSQDLERPVMLHVCKDGTITFRRHGQPVFNGMALPFFSVESEEEAQTLQVLMCSAQYGEHPDLPGQTWYRRSQFSGEIDGIPEVCEDFAKAYASILTRVAS